MPSVTISISKPLFSAKFHKDFKLQEILLTRSKGISNFKRELGIEVAIRSFQVNKNLLFRFFQSQLIVYIFSISWIISFSNSANI